MSDLTPPPNASACLLLADGTVFWGEGFGAVTMTAGELCFNTAMTGYQEILTDPSYTGQIITFTFPHIGNVGCNKEDIESTRHGAIGIITRERPTAASNFRSEISLDEWLKKRGIPGICGLDTRALVKHLRKHGAQNGVVFSWQSAVSSAQFEEAKKLLSGAPDMKGLDLAKPVSTAKPYSWNEPLWKLPPEIRNLKPETCHVIAIDYGAKHNILRHLAERGCKVTVMPATTKAEDILALKPDGIFLSNGPGDPAATGKYAISEIKKLIETNLPIFGICLGHQLLGIALGGKTEKMQQGHRGANHPVKNLLTGNVEITSQNHGFAVSKEGLPGDVEITHISLFDGTIQGLRHKTKPIFCVQGHPEASPGPHDSGYLFDEFITLMKQKSKASAA
ncbi:MAG: glutamine-hydrolyzing carbamoyl-phosphate synthase small subunit [Rickettsiales bacterium]|jgi:carbamoyl-phosphate synthase small subunit|nr:glutamine-hydrolyzing carbamoyl-phosphate synthase small subunit [Rickettsiales bacterium]